MPAPARARARSESISAVAFGSGDEKRNRASCMVIVDAPCAFVSGPRSRTAFPPERSSAIDSRLMSGKIFVFRIEASHRSAAANVTQRSPDSKFLVDVRVRRRDSISIRVRIAKMKCPSSNGAFGNKNKPHDRSHPNETRDSTHGALITRRHQACPRAFERSSLRSG